MAPSSESNAATETDAPTELAPLLRIQEVAELVGLTARSIRYYESIGLVEPAARSGGDYRLYDAGDIERLRFIKGLRDDAGFSLAEVGQLLEDEAARRINRERLLVARDPSERREIFEDALARIDRQVASLDDKIERLRAMVDEARARRARVERHLSELEPVAGSGAVR